MAAWFDKAAGPYRRKAAPLEDAAHTVYGVMDWPQDGHSSTLSPGEGTSTRSGWETRAARAAGSPLKVLQSGASTLPQWMYSL